MSNFINNNEYPRHIGDIWEQHPEFKFGDPTPAGWHYVEESDLPEPGENQRIDEGFPVLENGKYKRNWIIVDLSPEEIQARDAFLASVKDLSN